MNDVPSPTWVHFDDQRRCRRRGGLRLSSRRQRRSRDVEQYRVIPDTLFPLRLSYRVNPSDHHFELGDLAHYDTAFPKANRLEVQIIVGHRCIFRDLVSADAGGPDVWLTMSHRDRLLEELARAEAEGQILVAFIRAYVCDLATDGDKAARLFADARVAFAYTGHTHYEVLADSSVTYGATRSTGEIEEGGKPGFSIVTLQGRMPNWRLEKTGDNCSFVQIVSFADIRLVTRPADATKVPRPGEVEVVAKLFGSTLWSLRVTLNAEPHRVSTRIGTDRDVVEILVRSEADILHRAVPIALGGDIPGLGLGVWPPHDTAGTQRGLGKNGSHR